jgi:hypothetical protein
MPQFYFDIVAPARILSDEEGMDLFDLEAARAEAIKDARALMSDAIMGGLDISMRSIQIRNGIGDILLVIPFSIAVEPET